VKPLIEDAIAFHHIVHWKASESGLRSISLLGLISIFDKERKILKESAKCIVGEGECTNLKNPFKKSTRQ